MKTPGMRFRGFGLTIAALGLALGLAGGAGSWGSPGGDLAAALAIQSDGKIVLAGSTGAGFGKVLVTRFDADGRLDSSFGSSGRVVTDGDSGESVVLDDLGRILVVGRTHVFRYLADGRPDDSFGDHGSAALVPGQFAALAVQPDGAVVVGGRTGETPWRFLLERLRVDGTPDLAFGSGGVVASGFQNFADARGLALQPDDRIVAVGTDTDVATGAHALALARYLGDGQLDPSFGSGGRVRTGSCNGAFEGNRVAVSADGRITVAGTALARYLADGSVDSSFAAGQAVPLGFSATALFLQADGGALVAGGAIARYNAAGTIARYNAAGTLDRRFGVDGVLHAGQSVAAAALDQTGRLVVAGSAGDFRALHLELERFRPDGQDDRTFAGRQWTVEEIRALSTADGRLRTVLRADRISTASLSPDRRRLAFVRPVKGRFELDLVGADGKGLRSLLKSPFSGDELTAATTLSWSPDGRRIVLDAWPVPFPASCSTVTPSGSTYVLETATRKLSQLGSGTAPNWSPDGHWIASARAGKLLVQRPDGSGRRVLGIGTSLSWSPDGRRVAFVESPKHWIVVVGSDGRGKRRLVIGRQPVWSPDGSRIAYQRLDCPTARGTDCLRVVGSSGRGFVQLAGFRGGSLGPVSWSRDGTRIALPVWPRPPSAPRPWKMAVVSLRTRKARLYAVGEAPVNPAAPAQWGDGGTLYFVLRQIPDSGRAKPRPVLRRLDRPPLGPGEEGRNARQRPLPSMSSAHRTHRLGTHPARLPARPSGARIPALGRTLIFVPGRRVHFAIDCSPPNASFSAKECDAGWSEAGRWALRLNSRAWVTGWESVRSAHYDAYAFLKTRRHWVAGKRQDIVWHAVGRWDVYKKGKLIAYTRGPNGVAAGLMWLVDPAGR